VKGELRRETAAAEFRGERGDERMKLATFTHGVVTRIGVV